MISRERGRFHVKLRAWGILVVVLSASPALAFPGITESPCDQVPPLSAQQTVTESFVVYGVASKDMNTWCNKRPGPIMFGCTFQATADHPATIFLNTALTEDEQMCVMTYEMAHLPPNNWADPAAEALMVNNFDTPVVAGNSPMDLGIPPS